MSVLKATFGVLQKIGKSLMLPVSVLPVAGILLGVGSASSNHCLTLPSSAFTPRSFSLALMTFAINLSSRTSQPSSPFDSAPQDLVSVLEDEVSTGSGRDRAAVLTLSISRN